MEKRHEELNSSRARSVCWCVRARARRAAVDPTLCRSVMVGVVARKAACAQRDGRDSEKAHGRTYRHPRHHIDLYYSYSSYMCVRYSSIHVTMLRWMCSSARDYAHEIFFIAKIIIFNSARARVELLTWNFFKSTARGIYCSVVCLCQLYKLTRMLQWTRRACGVIELSVYWIRFRIYRALLLHDDVLLLYI